MDNQWRPTVRQRELWSVLYNNLHWKRILERIDPCICITACNAGDPGTIPGSGRSPGKERATHSSILALKIPWTERPGKLQSVGSRESHMTEWLNRTELTPESQFLGRLIRSPGSLRRREGSGALEEEIGVWGSWGGEKDRSFFL